MEVVNMKTVCFADLHGNYNLWTAIKNYYGPKDTLIFLGDACDRGPDGIKIMKEMFKGVSYIYIVDTGGKTYTGPLNFKNIINICKKVLDFDGSMC